MQLYVKVANVACPCCGSGFALTIDLTDKTLVALAKPAPVTPRTAMAIDVVDATEARKPLARAG